MKKGSGSDPFADMESGGQDETGTEEKGNDERENRSGEREPTAGATEAESRSESERHVDERASRADAPATTSSAVRERETSSSDSIIDDPPQNGASDAGVPWVYVRDNVKQDREMVQFYLRNYVIDAEDDFVDAVSEELGTDVSKTDVREAAYEAAMYNVDEVVDRLRDWGFESVD